MGISVGRSVQNCTSLYLTLIAFRQYLSWWDTQQFHEQDDSSYGLMKKEASEEGLKA